MEAGSSDLLQPKLNLSFHCGFGSSLTTCVFLFRLLSNHIRKYLLHAHRVSRARHLGGWCPLQIGVPLSKRSQA